jgi:hypothetical protein
VLIPSLQKSSVVCFDQLLQLSDFSGWEAYGAGQGNRFEPELRKRSVSLNVYVWRLAIFIAVKEKAICPYPEYRWHG